MSSGFSIADLPVVDDLNVPVSAEEYADQAGPSPVKPGNYRMVVTKHRVRTDKEGKLVLADGKYPTIVIEQVKIVEPTEAERLVGVFTDIRTKPFSRRTVTGDKLASELQDFLRACDETTGFDGFEHMKQLLQQYFDTNTPFLGSIAWTGYDKAYVEQEFAKIGGKANGTKEVVNAIYATARKATKDFVVEGALVSSILGASGETLEAQPKVSRFYPSLTEIGKGKDAKGRQRVELGPFKK